jgi:lipid A 3-O-deacylase
MTILLKLLVFVLSFYFAAHAAAQKDDTIQGWQLTIDNDLFGSGNRDRWYTNGIRLSWTVADSQPSNFFTRSVDELSRFAVWRDQPLILSYTIGQSMYTPQNINVAAPQPMDRPWGGYLYLGVSAHAYNNDEFRASELKVGVTGRAALGEQAQSLIHQIIRSSPPQGWDQQLKPRLGIQISHGRVYRILDDTRKNRVGFQIGWGAATGTLRTHANVNMAMLIGNLTGKDTPIMMGNEGDFVVQDFSNRDEFKKTFGYLALGYTGVAYNYFLQGDTPYGRPDLSPRKGYGTAQIGVSLPLREWVSGSSSWPRLVYSQTFRTAEFDSKDPNINRKTQRFGTLTFNWGTK